jgi:glycosyltransferase involved in cell wall biosynthesis
MLPQDAAIVIEGFRRRRRYDIVLSWGERYALMFALLCKLTRSRTPHVGMMYWFSKPKVARPIRLLHSHIERIITWNSYQMGYLTGQIGVPASKVRYTHYYVDQHFWRPMNVPTDMICAAGQEMRDYPTLFGALGGLDIRCHVAAGAVRLSGTLFTSHKEAAAAAAIPPNITVGTVQPHTALRELYARSRFVVMPLVDTDADNGITVILEAMAMGKAVICSRTAGQTDTIQDGITGLFVPVGDVAAMRKAIEYLWNNPSIAEDMGRNGRKFIEDHYTLDQFVANVRKTLEEVLDARRDERR